MNIDIKMRLKILHLGTELKWRGAENQIHVLVEGLSGKVNAQFVAYPRKSSVHKRTWACPTFSYDRFLSIWQLHNYIKQNDINIVDAHSAKAHALAIILGVLNPKLKICIHRHVDSVISKRWITRWKYLNKRVFRYIAVSNCIKNILIEYGVHENKIKVIKSTIDGDRFRKIDRKLSREYWLEKIKLPEDFVLIGNASALTEQKGYRTLIQAAYLVKKKYQKFAILIAGEGKLKEKFVLQTQRLGLEDNIFFLDFQENIPQFLGALDILVVPSNNEGLGTVILEGVYAGCAVIASEVGGIPEIIHHEKTGLLQAAGDYEKLAYHIEILIQKPEYRRELSEQALQFVEKSFSREKFLNDSLNSYKEMIET